MTRKQKTAKELRSQIYWLRRDLDKQRARVFVSETLNRAYREYLDEKFSWFIDLLAEGKTPNLPWLIKNIKDFLVRAR